MHEQGKRKAQKALKGSAEVVKHSEKHTMRACSSFCNLFGTRVRATHWSAFWKGVQTAKGKEGGSKEGDKKENKREVQTDRLVTALLSVALALVVAVFPTLAGAPTAPLMFVCIVSLLPTR